MNSETWIRHTSSRLKHIESICKDQGLWKLNVNDVLDYLLDQVESNQMLDDKDDVGPSLRCTDASLF